MNRTRVLRWALALVPAVLTLQLLLPLLRGESPLEWGLDLSGGTRITYRPDFSSPLEAHADLPRAELLELAKETLSSRLYRSLDTVPDVLVRGDGAIVASLPDQGGDEGGRRRALDLIGKTYHLSFALVTASQEPAGDRARTPYYRGRQLELEPAAFSGDMLDQRSLRVERRPPDPYRLESTSTDVAFRFRPPWDESFADFTERHRGEQLAILIDDRVEWAGTIESRIDGEGRLAGGYDLDEAIEIVRMLRAGSLPMSLELESLTTIGPALGQELLELGGNALLLSVAVLLGLVALVYLHRARLLLVGMLSLMCLLLYMTGAISLLGLRVDLVGVAGLILSVGMGMDAFFLIFEALEAAPGGEPRPESRVRRVYSFASEGATLFHANATTLIVVLLLAATQRLQSFALFMLVGISASVLTIFTTRTLLTALGPKLESGGPDLLGRLRRARPGVFRLRKVYFALVAVVIALALLCPFWPGAPTLELGADFEPGTQLVLRTGSDSATHLALSALRDGLPGVALKHQTLGDTDSRLLVTLDRPLALGSEGDHPATGTRPVRTDHLASILDRDDVQLDSVSSIDARISGKRLLQSALVLLVALPLLAFYLMVLQERIDGWYGGRADPRGGRAQFLVLCGVLGAVVVDLMLCAVVLALMDIPISLPVVAATLTVIGYSVNDSVVLWAHARRDHRLGEPAVESVSGSVDRILGRALLTSVSTMVPAIAILGLGLEPLRGFALVILTGTVAGTLSSLFLVGSVAVKALSCPPEARSSSR